MANKKFTEQEMITLRNSKYVLDVSPSIVHFSAEFKKLFWEELSKGRLPREIVSTLICDEFAGDGACAATDASADFCTTNDGNAATWDGSSNSTGSGARTKTRNCS